MYSTEHISNFQTIRLRQKFGMHELCMCAPCIPAQQYSTIVLHFTSTLKKWA